MATKAEGTSMTDEAYTTPTNSPAGSVAATMPRRNNATRIEMLKDLMLILFEDEVHAIFDMLCHNKVRSIHQFCNRNDDGLQKLQKETGGDIDFQLFMDLRAVQQFIKYAQLNGQTINPQFITHLGIEEFEHFIISGWNSSNIDTMRQLPGCNHNNN